MLDVWEKFSHAATTTQVRIQEFNDTVKLLPCLTVCPWSAFKNKGFYYNIQEFFNNTYEFNDVFETSLKMPCLNKSELQFETIPSIYLGRCYMVCIGIKVTSGQTFCILLKNRTDVTG